MNSHEGDEQARSTAEAVARRSYGKLVAFLAARTHDVASAEDALSEAFAAALADWPRNGCPANPEAWLMTVGRRKMIDVFRGERRSEIASEELQIMARRLEAAAADADRMGEIPDQRLALMFACAHPAIEAGIRAPLILQVILGLDAKAIASAFLTSPAAMGEAAGAGQGKDPAGWDSFWHSGTRGTSWAARDGIERDLCGICGRVVRPGRDRCRAAGSQRRGDVSGEAGDGVTARGTGGSGPAGAGATRGGTAPGAAHD